MRSPGAGPGAVPPPGAGRGPVLPPPGRGAERCGRVAGTGGPGGRRGDAGPAGGGDGRRGSPQRGHGWHAGRGEVAVLPLPGRSPGAEPVPFWLHRSGPRRSGPRCSGPRRTGPGRSARCAGREERGRSLRHQGSLGSGAARAGSRARVDRRRRGVVAGDQLTAKQPAAAADHEGHDGGDAHREEHARHPLQEANADAEPAGGFQTPVMDRADHDPGDEQDQRRQREKEVDGAAPDSEQRDDRADDHEEAEDGTRAMAREQGKHHADECRRDEHEHGSPRSTSRRASAASGPARRLPRPSSRTAAQTRPARWPVPPARADPAAVAGSATSGQVRHPAGRGRQGTVRSPRLCRRAARGRPRAGRELRFPGLSPAGVARPRVRRPPYPARSAGMNRGSVVWSESQPRRAAGVPSRGDCRRGSASSGQPPASRGARRAGSPRVDPGWGSHPGGVVIAGEGNA